VYEISYSTEQGQYLEHLPIVEQMVNSFQLIKHTNAMSNMESKMTNSKNEDNPLAILKRRFATGEITEEEYKRMRHILET
jgi:uncharacterized membrane protein